MSDDTVSLRVKGRIFSGWTGVDLTFSLETMSNGFSVGLTEQWPGHQDRYQMAPGMDCEVAIGGETVIDGFIDDVDLDYSATDHSVSVRGRDATGDLVDCSALHTTGHWTSQSLVAIATELCRPFGIPVTSKVKDAYKTVLEHHIQMGESVHECLERLARSYGVMLVSDGQGGLVITRAGEDGAAAGLRLGGNILSARGALTDRDRYSRYIIIGQSSGGEYIDPAILTIQHAEAKDAGISRYRPLIVMAEDSIDPTYYQRRAIWEAANRAGKSRRATVKVQGWRDAAGKLYKPNTMVTIDDDWLGLHESMLICGVKLSLNDQGQLAELTLTRREAFELVPPTATLYDPAATP